MNPKPIFDKFGTAIICRNCKRNGFEYFHYRYECRRCFECGDTSHGYRHCPSINTAKQIKINFERRHIRDIKLIDNSSQLRPNQTVSLSLERVIGHKEQLPAWVVVYRHLSNHYQRKYEQSIVYSAHIRHSREKIKAGGTAYSGLMRTDVSENAVDFDRVQKDLSRILPNRLVIGINLKATLKELRIKSLVPKVNRFEFHDHFYDSQKRPINLKALVYVMFNKRIQEYDPSYHIRGRDPFIDCEYLMDIYRMYSITKVPAIQPLATDGDMGKLKFECHQWIRNIIEFAEQEGWLKQIDKPIKSKSVPIDWSNIPD